MHYIHSHTLALFLVAVPVVLALGDSVDSHGIRRQAKPGERRARLDTHPTWSLTDSYQGKQFLEGFTFENSNPTRGRVNYVDMATAIAHNLTEATRDNFIMRVDSTNVLDPSGPGRESIRLQSKKEWTTGVSILNLNHMPEGCGTWPAYWMSQHGGPPINGQVDVIEGVNDQSPNLSSLHTINNCTMAPNHTMTGTATSTNCSYLNNNNQGCGVQYTRQDAYGPPFNAIGGGWWVTERTNSRISIWFWGRKDYSVPLPVKEGLPIISTESFGTPVAVWEASSTCDFETVFGPENIIINLNLCGSWAGQNATFKAAGCPGTCVDYVNNNPAAFKKAYWDIAWLKVYAKAG